jgi:hypothetical protein
MGRCCRTATTGSQGRAGNGRAKKTGNYGCHRHTGGGSLGRNCGDNYGSFLAGTRTSSGARAGTGPRGVSGGRFTGATICRQAYGCAKSQHCSYGQQCNYFFHQYLSPLELSTPAPLIRWPSVSIQLLISTPSSRPSQVFFQG